MFFFNMLNIATLNAYVIYLHNFHKSNKNPQFKPKSRFYFMQMLVSEISKPWLLYRLDRRLPPSLKEMISRCLGCSSARKETSLESAIPDQVAKRKYCAYCSYKKRRLTKSRCEKCKAFICGEHKKNVCVNCFL